MVYIYSIFTIKICLYLPCHIDYTTILAFIWFVLSQGYSIFSTLYGIFHFISLVTLISFYSYCFFLISLCCIEVYVITSRAPLSPLYGLFTFSSYGVPSYEQFKSLPYTNFTSLIIYCSQYRDSAPLATTQDTEKSLTIQNITVITQWPYVLAPRPSFSNQVVCNLGSPTLPTVDLLLQYTFSPNCFLGHNVSVETPKMITVVNEFELLPVVIR